MTENFKIPLVSVIVCTYSLKRFDNIVSCIKILLDNSYKNLEIIIVVDGNEELRQNIETIYMKNDNVHIIENKKNEGPSVSRNRGIEFAKGDIVAFIDDDAFASSNWVETIVKNFSEYPEIMICGGKLIPVYEKGAQILSEELLWIVGCTYKGHPIKKQFVRNVISANMAVRKDVFDSIKFEKMFDGKNWKMEDTLFCMRFNDMRPGLILYIPELIVHHVVPADRTTTKYIIQRSYSEGILKAELGRVVSKNFSSDTFSYERDYLLMLISTILNKFLYFRMKDGFLITVAMCSVLAGYLNSKIGRLLSRI